MCADHSQQLGYRWNPLKCVILEPNPIITYQLYDTEIPRLETFNYLGIPIGTGGTLDAAALITNNTKKALNSMTTLSSIGLNGSGYGRLLASRIYQQFIRPQLEYGLAITMTTKKNTKRLDATQDTCLRRIYGAHSRSSTIIMKQLSGIPYMVDRLNILQLKYMTRARYQPSDTLLHTLTTHLTRPSSKLGIWHKLLKQPLIQHLPP
ncbi:hypothetical protein BC941DRAFT_364479, partial [Chlamydoabsidia padenii]